MEGGDGPSLDAGNKDSVGIVLVLLNKVPGSLLGGDGNQRHTLVSWLEPNNLGLVLVTVDWDRP